MTGSISPKLMAGIAVGALAVLALVLWFGFASSQKSKSSSLDAQIAQAQADLDVAKATPVQTTPTAKGKAAPFVLAKAFPTDPLMPSLLLQVQRVARNSGITLDTFTPSAASPLSGYNAIPIDLTVTGRYKEIQRFVHRLRVQAGTTTTGHPHAKGRLFAVETLGLTPGGKGLPSLSATIRLDAFVYTGVVQAITPVTPLPTDSTEATTTEAGTSQ